MKIGIVNSPCLNKIGWTPNPKITAMIEAEEMGTSIDVSVGRIYGPEHGGGLTERQAADEYFKNSKLEEQANENSIK